MNGFELKQWLERFSVEKAKPLVMGVLNVTPDSFYEHSRFVEPKGILARVETMLDEGLDILDLGAESTRPNSTRIDIQTELDRIIPVIQLIRQEYDVCISVDTYKPEVMRASLDVGASMINDVTGLNSIDSIEVIKNYDVPVCVMHISGGLEIMNQPFESEDSVVDDILDFFSKKIQAFLDMGLSRNNLIIDPGVGFGKGTQENLSILKNFEQFTHLKQPSLIGVSRKRFIGEILDKSVDERLYGSLGANLIAYTKGCRIFRTHDVLATKESLKVAEAIFKSD